MPSPTVPLSVEYAGNRRGDRGRRIDGDAERRGGRAGIAGHIGGGGGQAVGAVGERGRRIGPVAAAIGGGAAEQGGAVIDLDRGIGFRGAGERQGIVIGDAVAGRAAVGRVRRQCVGNDRGRGVDGDAERRGRRAGVAGDIGGGGGQAVGAVGERGRGDSSRSPLPLAVALPSRVAPS